MFFEGINEELKKESEQCLPQLKEIVKQSDNYYKQLDLVDKSVLMILLNKAIDKLDELQNQNEYEIDQRDVMDILCDKEFIFEDLVKDSIEYCELYIG